MGYEHITLGNLIDLLGDRLGDGTFWTVAERRVYVKEALRTWGMATGYWREQGSFVTVSGTAFYALETQLSSLLGFTITDRDLIEAMQYHLLEDATSQAVWNGTEMFTLMELARALQHRRNRFLIETGQVLTRSTAAMPAPPIERVQLADTIIDVRRAAWLSAANVYSHLFREDQWELTAVFPDWTNTPSTPVAYTQIGNRPLELIVAPPPSATGTLELITVSTGSPFTPDSAATAVGVFDNYAAIVKWGAIADLLSGDGQEADLIRAHSAERRWIEGVELAKMQDTIHYTELNGVAVLPGSVWEMDAVDNNWQNNSGTPFAVGIIGQNLVALNKVPDGIYSVLFTVTRNAPIPAGDGGFIEIGREEITAVLDYAQYLALFKLGGTEMQEAERNVQNFYQAASLFNGRLKASAVFADVIRGASTREEKSRLRVVGV